MSDMVLNFADGSGPILTRKTSKQAPSDARVAEWQAVLSDLVLPVRAEVEMPGSVDVVPPDFSGCLRIGRFGPSAWLEIDATAQVLHRGPAEIRASAGRWLFVSTMTRGYGWLNAGGERKLVECGQTVFVDSAQAYSLEFDAEFAFVSAMLPRADLLVYQPHAPGAHATRVRDPVGTALHSFLKSLAVLDRASDSVLWSSGRRLYDHFVGLVLSAIEPLALSAIRDRPSPNEVLMNRIRSALLASLSHPQLNTAWVAERFGLSMRKVQRLFNAEGTTFTKWLLEQRLARCAEELADPDLDARPIGDIAQSWGLNDLSYFGRAFSRRYGMKPGQFRESRQGKPSAPASRAGTPRPAE